MVEAAGVEPAESERKPQQNRPFALICPSLCPRVTRRSPTGEARDVEPRIPGLEVVPPAPERVELVLFRDDVVALED
jgi:hypothetical protein